MKQNTNIYIFIILFIYLLIFSYTNTNLYTYKHSQSVFNGSTPSLGWLFHYFHLQSMQAVNSVLNQKSHINLFKILSTLKQKQQNNNNKTKEIKSLFYLKFIFCLKQWKYLMYEKFS